MIYAIAVMLGLVILALASITLVAYVEMKAAKDKLAACETKLWTTTVNLENRMAELATCRTELNRAVAAHNNKE